MILVTGGTGLVGSHLLYHLLLENEQVRAIHLRTSNLETVKTVFSFYGPEAKSLYKNIHWVEADLNDIPALEMAFTNVTRVYHCAALISFSARNYQKMRRVNIDGTTNIVNFCIRNQVGKLCFVSSVAAIENGQEGEIMDETDNWNNNSEKSGYSITKYGAEMEVWRASQEGVPVVIVNPGVIIGPGFWNKGSGKMFSSVKKGLKFYTNGTTGFVCVNDVVELMIKLMKVGIENERFVLVSDNLTYKHVLEKIAKAMGVPKPKYRVGSKLLSIIWRLEWIKSKINSKEPLLTKHTARSSVAIHPYSSKKIENLLNYQFSSVDECIVQTAKLFGQNQIEKP